MLNSSYSQVHKEGGHAPPPYFRSRNQERTHRSPARESGWNVHDGAQVGIEIPVDGFDPYAWRKLEKQLRQIREQAQIKEINLPAGISDYVLYRENGEILAVVEAKKTSICTSSKKVGQKWQFAKRHFLGLYTHRRLQIVQASFM